MPSLRSGGASGGSNSLRGVPLPSVGWCLRRILIPCGGIGVGWGSGLWLCLVVGKAANCHWPHPHPNTTVFSTAALRPVTERQGSRSLAQALPWLYKSLFKTSLHAALAGLFSSRCVTAPAGASRRNRRRRLLAPGKNLAIQQVFCEADVPEGLRGFLPCRTYCTRRCVQRPTAVGGS